ncbi:MAG: sugar ABC transporter substrate-binding protein [Candidatus Devosia phytovorans]|uniref:Sugar ABC transporter substrate-binding protein n=1 Tax=Candidatus Devosia phytovorans TaxID=3121372 RepID=A0AAJ6AYB1_9HYPH|nr:sugar ABC transporter substrate-binding protein [Devosia sp.]WEK03380.1 MAG: sugar ABC transporter substrate-binding protein [Devosia sp.]
MKLRFALLTSFAVAGVATALPAMAQDPFRIAYLASSSQNGYNQAIYAGIQEAAAAKGVEVEIFDGAFDSTKQFSQVEDVVAGGRFDALIVTPNDSVGIAPALEDAAAAGLTVASTLFPIGSDLTNMEPQVPGLTTTVAANPAIGAKAQADAVVDYCADKDPCRVAVIIGQLIYPFDNLRNETYKEVFAEHANIQIVATGEGNYDPDTALTAMQDILQANPEIDAVLSNADQPLIGVEIALNDFGYNPGEVYMIGGGLNQITIDAIRAGKVAATLAEVPHSMGEAALEAVVTTLEGGTAPTWIDPFELSTTPVIVTKEWLDANPDFVGEWQG